MQNNLSHLLFCLATLFSSFRKQHKYSLWRKQQDYWAILPLLFFPAGLAWGAPWAQAQLKNRLEGPGRRQLTGEPTFLTQVPKESDANTPSALSIAFICSLLHVPLPFGEGALLGHWALHVLFLGTFWGWDKGTIPGGSSHSPAFANVQREHVAVTTPRNKFVFSPLLCLALQLDFKLGFKRHFSPLILYLSFSQQKQEKLLGQW